MSWDGYVANLVGDKSQVTKAAFFGHDGSIWAKSADLNITPQEALAIVSTFNSPNKGFETGFVIGGQKHMCIRASSDHICGKMGTSGFSAYKTGQSVVFGYYVEPATPGNCDVSVGKYADYLSQNGY